MAETIDRNDFLLEVCEELFGCFIQPTMDEGHECGCCERPMLLVGWVNAEHNEGCIIPRVRDYLATHKPECVPGVVRLIDRI